MRILILTSSTGGGHNMRAASFKAWVEKKTHWEVRIHHALENTHGLYRFGVGVYNWIQKTYPRLHHLYFNYLELAAMHRKAKRIMGAERFLEILRDFKPQALLSTHAHLNHGFFELARQELGRENIRCVTYCGELFGGYGFSKHWVNPDADLFIGAVEECSKTAVKLGMAPEKTWTGGFLLKPEFYEKNFSSQARERFLTEELGFDPNAFVLVLSTGAVGANNHLRILKQLEKRRRPLQVAVLCGKNKAAFQKVYRWGRKKGRILKVKPLAYWTRMSILFQSATAVVARPGTGTTSEAILCGTPVIMNGIGGIMPQEWITVKFGMHHSIIRVAKSPGDIARILDNWQRRPSEVQQLATNIRRQKPKQTPVDILEKVTGEPVHSVQDPALVP